MTNECLSVWIAKEHCKTVFYYTLYIIHYALYTIQYLSEAFGMGLEESFKSPRKPIGASMAEGPHLSRAWLEGSLRCLCAPPGLSYCVGRLYFKQTTYNIHMAKT